MSDVPAAMFNGGEIVFRGRKFDIERCSFEVRGTRHTWDIIRHPGAAAVLPVLDDGRVVLVYNRRVAVNRELLEVPAGTLDDREPPELCAARELTEETGYRATRLELLATCYSSPGILDERMHSFLATGLVPGPTAHESGEQIRVTTMGLEEALAAIRWGDIVDGKTILTLLYYDRFVRDGGGNR